MGRSVGHAERHMVRSLECADGRLILRGPHGETLVDTAALGRLHGPAIEALRRELEVGR